MKKTLIVSMILALGSLAAAQSTDSTTTDTTNTGTSTGTTGTDTSGTTGTSTDTTNTTTQDSSQGTTTDTSTGTSTDTSTGGTSTTGTSTGTTTGTESTTTQGTTTPGTGTGAAETLSADQYFQRAQEQAAQAEIAYPAAFVDRTLWRAAVNDASQAAQAAPDNRQYQSYAAQLYTKTQWWINAYNGWSKLQDLTDQEKDLAALSAAKLGYLALQRGDKTTARQYVTQGIQWKNTQALQDLMKRL